MQKGNYNYVYTMALFFAFVGDEVKEVVTPAFADSVSEGDVRWEKNVGDQVAEDETVLEIETDKVFYLFPIINQNQ